MGDIEKNQSSSLKSEERQDDESKLETSKSKDEDNANNNHNEDCGSESEEEFDIVEFFDQMLYSHNSSSEQAKAILGGQSEDECSYSQGYVDRQAIFACKTCEMATDPTTGEKFYAGICMACAYKCHTNHDLEELYLRRDFRCDCGNDKFVSNKCKLYKKVGMNENNKYNHNFAGLYCICNEAYDPRDHKEMTMVTCGICEDWYHNFHLDNFDKMKSEIICTSCLRKNPFLIYYREAGYLDCDEDPKEIKEEKEGEEFNFEEFQKEVEERMNKPIDLECKLELCKKKYKEKFGTEDIQECHFTTLYPGIYYRCNLCNCVSCQEMYEKLEITFITNPKDMVEYKGLENTYLEDKKLRNCHTPAQLYYLQDGITDYFNELKKLFQDKNRAGETKIELNDVNNFRIKLEQISNKRKKNANYKGIKYFCK